MNTRSDIMHAIDASVLRTITSQDWAEALRRERRFQATNSAAEQIRKAKKFFLTPQLGKSATDAQRKTM